MIKVLLFAANPRGTAPLDLPREFREIDEEVRRGSCRDEVELIIVPGARPIDLLRKLNESQPQVVHFSSHGSPEEIFLESECSEAEATGLFNATTRSTVDRDMTKVSCDSVEDVGMGRMRGTAQPLPGSALVDVLRSCNDGHLRLVVLNACDTRGLARGLTEVVDCVVSMNAAITDLAAIKFAASFYGALAFGRSVQMAFDQGVARLRVEAVAEAGSPTLLVRSGVDASRVVLVGLTPIKPATQAPDTPFVVPFPRNREFVGREGDLARLHSNLSGPGPGPVGIRPAGLTGMGGIGKTQLAVQYAYRHRSDYPDGVFWIDGAIPLAEGFARLATDSRLGWAAPDQPRDEQIRAAFSELSRRDQALLVIDNLLDPATLATPVLLGCTPEDLGCRLLFTTRRHDLGRFPGVEVTVLPEEPALQLLLRHPTRRAALDPSHPDHEHARAIVRMLGRLPLALELAGAYLGKFSSDVSLAEYRSGLRAGGALATLDEDAAELSEADLRRVHDSAVAATIGEQWQTRQDESEPLLLRIASLFQESAAIPIVRLGMLAGLGDESRPGKLSPLRRAVRRLDDACLLERLEGDQIRLHPLIREFAVRQTPPGQIESFVLQCMARVATGLEDFAVLGALEVRRGVEGLQEDLIAILELCPDSAPDISARLQAILRLLQRETHYLRDEDQRFRPVLFAQQVRNRAFLLGIGPLQSTAEQRLSALGRPHFRLRWTASRESPALIRTFAGRQDCVWAVAISPDGRHVLAGSDDCTLKLWDLATGQPRLSFAGHTGAVCAVAILPDGHHALSGSADGTLRLWDLTTGQVDRVFSEHRCPVYALAITPDGRHAVSGARDGTLKLWDLSTDQALLSLTANEGFVSALDVTPDGRRAISGYSDGSLKIWNLGTGELRNTSVGHAGPVYALAITPDGGRVLSGSLDGDIRLWDLPQGRPLTVFPGHKDDVYKTHAPVYALAITPDGRRVLTGGGDGAVKLWGLSNTKPCGCFIGHERGVTSLAVTPDGRHALSASTDETIKLWDLGSRESFVAPTGHEKGVSAIAVTPDGRLALSGSRDSTMRLWHLEPPQPFLTIARHQDWVTALAITPDGRVAISGCEDCIVRIWDLETRQLLSSLIGHQGGVTAVAAAPNARHVLSGSRDGTLKLWDLSTNQLLLEFAAGESSVGAVAITLDSRQAIAGYFDGSLTLWDLLTGESVLILAAHKSRVRAVAITPDGRSVVSGSDDGTVQLWDLSTGRHSLTLTGHDDRVTAAVVTSSGRHVLSGSEDRTLRLWAIEDCSCRAVIPLGSAPLAIATSPDSRSLVVGDRVGNVHYYQIHVR